MRPYIDRLNQQVYTPSVNFGRENYAKYGASRVDQARNYSQEQWSKVIKPQIDAAQSQAQDQYSSNVAPHVTKASAAAAPYYSAGIDSVSDVYNNHISPTYDNARPYLERSLNDARRLLVDVCFPYLQSATRSINVFFSRILWPRIRILYGENVEPQLVRIGERLGSYRDGRKLKSVVSDFEPSISSTFDAETTVSTSLSAAQDASVTISSSVAPTETALSPEEEAQQVREKIENDLTNWEAKFAKAADTGAEDLKERVSEITNRQLSHLEGVGEALVIELEETYSSEQTKLQKKILSVVRSLGDNPAEDALASAEEHLSKATRKAGVAVRDKAQGLRTWKASFDTETHALVLSAANSTLEVIDSIRDLGLQEIGMRWAWMEGVTYKDWSKYHDVKKTFDHWRRQVLDVALNHDGFRKAKISAEKLESKGMDIAEDAANELSRLKEVGNWKIQASDDSDDFSTIAVPPRAAAAGQKVLDKISSMSEQVAGNSQGSAESIISQATDKIAEVASDASEKVIGTEPSVPEKASSAVAEKIAAISQTASSALVGTPKPIGESVYSAAKEKVSDFASDGSAAIIGTPAPKSESIYSMGKDKVEQASSGAKEAISAGHDSAVSLGSDVSASLESAASAISEAVSESSSRASAKVSSAMQEGSSSASSAASKPIRKIPGGAMAQEVHGQKPILDDVTSDSEEDTFSERVKNIVDQAGQKYSDAARAITEALKPSTTSSGSIASITSLADDQLSRAYLAASSILYGTDKGVAQSAADAASGKWSDAVAAYVNQYESCYIY